MIVDIGLIRIKCLMVKEFNMPQLIGSNRINDIIELYFDKVIDEFNINDNIYGEYSIYPFRILFIDKNKVVCSCKNLVLENLKEGTKYSN